MPPISIDGTDITGATIDGTDVQEITVDGQTVFTAETLPVAYSNLVAWWPFDSSFYGGSNADDVTALFNPGQSGDSTAYDGSVSGANYQSSGGVTDINAGANSGAFEFDGSNDNIDLGPNTFTFLNGNECSFCCWFEADVLSGFETLYDQEGVIKIYFKNATLKAFVTGFSDDAVTTSLNTNNFFHVVLTFDGVNTQELYLDGVSVDTGSGSMFDLTNLNRGVTIGSKFDGTQEYFDGIIDDVRIYDKELSSSEVSDIYNNTQP